MTVEGEQAMLLITASRTFFFVSSATQGYTYFR